MPDEDRRLNISKSISRVFLGPRIAPNDERSIYKVLPNQVGIYKRIVDAVESKEHLQGFEVGTKDMLDYWLLRKR